MNASHAGAASVRIEQYRCILERWPEADLCTLARIHDRQDGHMFKRQAMTDMPNGQASLGRAIHAIVGKWGIRPSRHRWKP